MKTYRSRVRVRAYLSNFQVEFERMIQMTDEPAEGMVLGFGCAGGGPLLLTFVVYSICEALFVCRAEDDLAARDFGTDTEALAAAYESAGWTEVFRVRLDSSAPNAIKGANAEMPGAADEPSLQEKEPRDMGSDELADALLAHSWGAALSRRGLALLDEAAARLCRRHALEESLARRAEQVRRLEEELTRLRGRALAEGRGGPEAA